MILQALVRTPDGVHVYRLGEHDDTGTHEVCALLDGIRAAHAFPAEWVDLVDDDRRPLWGLNVTGPLDPDRVAELGATVHDLTIT